jgi:arabinofuranan 3-O-arabinosyltransferase
MGSTESSRDKRRVLFLALVAALPTFALRAGELNADTKLYLSTTPGRLLANAAHAWDSSQFLGYVPHQAVGYLWPMGPFFWLGDLVGAPDWLMQRLWLSLIFTAAGTGAYFFLRHLGLRVDGATAGALCFQVTPYVLSYQSRTSVMLLPWAAVGWLALVSSRGARTRSWLHPSLIALLVFTVGGINATALIMVAPVVLIVALHQKTQTQRTAVFSFLWRSALLSALCSAWWISMLAIQARYGADVLSFSETLEAVSSTSTSFEVIRGMGYWLNYVVSGPHYGTSAAISLLSSPLALMASTVIPAAAIAWLALSRHRYVPLASTLVIVGLVTSTGAYGMSSSSFLMRMLSSNSESSFALALRSSTRAIPVLLLGVAVAWAGLSEMILDFLRRTTSRSARGHFGLLAPASTIAILFLSLPSLRSTGVTDSSLSRPPNAPVSWEQTAAILDSSISSTSRVLQTPGQEFGAYDWGFTVDPAWPTVSQRPLATRDLLPLGGVQAMDQLYALDDAVQEGTTNDGGIRNTARRLGAGVILLPSDLDEGRFQTTPQEVALRENNLSPDITVPASDGAHALLLDRDTEVSTLMFDMTQVSGSGEGLVSADSYDLLKGRLVEYTADQSVSRITTAASENIPLVVTDSNRIRARHWRTSYDTVGYSEDGTSESRLLEDDYADRRLNLFPTGTDSSSLSEYTIVRQEGVVTAKASSYGTPLLYWPENRPAAAIDGDLTTAWTTAAFANPTGETLTLASKTPFTDVRLIQPISSSVNRWITQVSYSTDGESFSTFELNASSRRPTGQVLQLETPATQLTLRIELVDWTTDGPQDGLDGVGFAEVQLGFPATREITELPSRALSASSGSRPVAYQFNRSRARTTSSWRRDPEVSLSRLFLVPDTTALQGEVRGSLALDAEERVTAPWLEVTTYATGRFTRDFSTAGWNATDGKDETSWISPGGITRGAQLSFISTSASPGSITQPMTDEFSQIRKAVLSDGRHSEVVTFDRETGVGRFTSDDLNSGRWTLTVTDVDTEYSTDHRTYLPIARPVAISEIRANGVATVSPQLPTSPRTLSVVLNDKEIRLTPRWFGSVNRPRYSAMFPTTDVDGGNATFRTSSLMSTGIGVDDVVLKNEAWNRQEAAASDATGLSMSGGPTSRRIAFPGCARDCWFVFGEGHNPGWTARLDGVDLGAPRQVNGGFNGWPLPAGSQAGSISLEFRPQRWLTAGLLVTAVTVLALTLVIIRAIRRRSIRHEVTVDLPRDRHVSQSSSGFAHRLFFIIGGAVIVALVSQPVYFLPALALLVVATWQRHAQLSRSLSALWVLFSLLVALCRVLIADPPIRFDWPHETGFVHWHLLASIALIAIIANSPSSTRPKSGRRA